MIFNFEMLQLCKKVIFFIMIVFDIDLKSLCELNTVDLDLKRKKHIVRRVYKFTHLD
jgi:hypothetical protein